jgi:hypothetical protein
MRKIAVSFSAMMILGACHGPAAEVPGAKGPRESGQSSLMENTYAGKNACNAKNHDRPFIIEWDATDMSSFESHAANDLVVVEYKGCELKVLDSCNDDSIKGSVGTYKPVEWTSGSLEKIEISNEGELYAKLPLGAATLGGRVSAGEKFLMEYYVAGIRKATRDHVYMSDLQKIPGCKGATHFVYAYNLGAFALGSVTNFEASADASMYGFGGGGSKKTSTKADKKGGDLATCKSSSAKEIDGCKVPIRLSLREIDSGENPDIAQSKAPDTDTSLNAAAKVDAKVELQGKAGEQYKAAAAKMNAKDGKGCLKELDAHDKSDPKNQSTDPKSDFGMLRAQCLMLAGQCPAGKQLLRKTYETKFSSQMGPEQIDKSVEALGTMYCQGSLTPREELLQALQVIQQGAYMTKKDVATCNANIDKVKKLAPKVKPNDDEDTQVTQGPKQLYVTGANCLARAGDCTAAKKVFIDGYPGDLSKVKDPATKEKIINGAFEATVPKCKGK